MQRSKYRILKKIIKRIKLIWLSEIMCILFHSIRPKKKFYVIDSKLRKPFVRYECQTCGRRFLANSIRDWYRIKWSKKFKKKKV